MNGERPLIEQMAVAYATEIEKLRNKLGEALVRENNLIAANDALGTVLAEVEELVTGKYSTVLAIQSIIRRYRTAAG